MQHSHVLGRPSPVAFVTVRGYSSGLLLGVVDLLWRGLTDKLNCITGIYVLETSISRFGTSRGFRHPRGSWPVSPADKGGN